RASRISLPSTTRLCGATVLSDAENDGAFTTCNGAPIEAPWASVDSLESAPFGAGARVTINAPATRTNPAATADGAIHDQRALRPAFARLPATTGSATATSGANTIGSSAKRVRSAATNAASRDAGNARSSERSTSPIK